MRLRFDTSLHDFRAEISCGDFLDFQRPQLPAQLNLDERYSLGVRDHTVDATNDAEDITALSGGPSASPATGQRA